MKNMEIIFLRSFFNLAAIGGRDIGDVEEEEKDE